jgi:hypothetical protein
MSDLSDSDSSLGEDGVVFTVQEVIRTGLSILHYTKKKIRKAKRATNLVRFKGHYGVLPVVVCELIQDLQTELKGKLYIPKKKMVLQYVNIESGSTSWYREEWALWYREAVSAVIHFSM